MFYVCVIYFNVWIEKGKKQLEPSPRRFTMLKNIFKKRKHGSYETPRNSQSRLKLIPELVASVN